jgi:DNA-directed RNA polymerase specialized sigma24 family protein
MRLFPRRPEEVTDTEIVRLLKAKNSKGLQLLLQKHAGRARFQLRQEFGGRMDCTELDGVINHAAYQAWSRVETFDANRGELGAWFFVIARNYSRTVCKQDQHRAHGLEGMDPGASLHSGPAEGVEPSSQPDRFALGLRECIAQLPRMQQQVIQADLRSGDVANAAELAAEFKTSTNSIYVSRSNARKALKKGLEAMGLFEKEGLEESAG